MVSRGRLTGRGGYCNEYVTEASLGHVTRVRVGHVVRATTTSRRATPEIVIEKLTTIHHLIYLSAILSASLSIVLLKAFTFTNP